MTKQVDINSRLWQFIKVVYYAQAYGAGRRQLKRRYPFRYMVYFICRKINLIK